MQDPVPEHESKCKLMRGNTGGQVDRRSPIVPLYQLCAVHRFRSFHLVPRLVSDSGQGCICRQRFASSVITVSNVLPSSLLSSFMSGSEVLPDRNLQAPVNGESTPDLKGPLNLERAVDLELAKDLDLVRTERTSVDPDVPKRLKLATMRVIFC